MIVCRCEGGSGEMMRWSEIRQLYLLGWVFLHRRVTLLGQNPGLRQLEHETFVCSLFSVGMDVQELS